MFGLYGDLPPAAKQDAADAPADGAPKTNWSSALAAQLKPAPRKPALAPPPSVLRAAQQQAAHARALPLPPPRPSAAAAPPAPPGAGASVQSPPLAHAPRAAAASLSAVSAEEYDPAVPNNYDDAVRARALKRKQEELEEKRRALDRQRQVRRLASQAGRLTGLLRGAAR
jgi:hypothetical protein